MRQIFKSECIYKERNYVVKLRKVLFRHLIMCLQGDQWLHTLLRSSTRELVRLHFRPLMALRQALCYNKIILYAPPQKGINKSKVISSFPKTSSFNAIDYLFTT